MACFTLFANIISPPPSLGSKLTSNNNNNTSYPRRKRRRRSDGLHGRRRGACSCSLGEYDLYELLGVESGSDQAGIKTAYRALQKRCHPDIAGPAGHDMAIILNQVYALLSDPISRSAYDQEQAKLSEFRGYTGKPLYSTWCGAHSEERAVFVDEIKCVGCLKCALFASNTFAVESMYGRARVVAQWADPEDKIFDAIQTCPVDCISIVERSNLAALEFLMSKQPRGHVRMTAGNTVGERVSNIFSDVNQFQRRYNEMKDKASNKESKDSDQRESRNSAMQGIRSISNWWYWLSPNPTEFQEDRSLALTCTTRKSWQPDTERLREAAVRCKARQTSPLASMNYEHSEEYWRPLLVLPSQSITSNSEIPSEHPQNDVVEDTKERISVKTADEGKGRMISLEVPIVMAMISAATIGFKGGEMSNGVVREHIGGATALEVVNSFELQILLGGITWFVIGMAIMGFVEALRSKGMFRR